jgi:hypothetical protein
MQWFMQGSAQVQTSSSIFMQWYLLNSCVGSEKEGKVIMLWFMQLLDASVHPSKLNLH